VDAEERDWLLRFLHEFASMSDVDRDAALDALAPPDREALVALAEARVATAEANLIEILDAGQGGLEKLYELTQPVDLFTVINLAVRERPNLVVEALFAALVLHRGGDQQAPDAIAALREGWHWHVHEEIASARSVTESRERG
jgi:hypothetical protein